MIELSVVVPCLDEELNVPELVGRVLAVLDEGGIDGELVLVDDGSTDGTWRVIEEHVARHPGRVVGVRHAQNRGIAAAWRSGAERARGALVTILDADLQYRPEDVLRLHRAYRQGDADVVQGWRSPAGRARDRRYHLSRGFNALLNATFGMRLRDNKSGFLLCEREIFLDLLRHDEPYAYWQSFVMVAAHARGLAIREVETLFDRRRQGASFLDAQALRVSARSLIDVARAVREYRLRATGGDPTPVFLGSRGLAPAEPPSRRAHPARWRVYMAAFDRTHWMITRRVERQLELLEATQWMSPDDVRALQDERLRRVVRHAYRRVPFWRARMQAAGLGPDDVRSVDDLHKLPLLDKAEVRAHVHRGLLQEGVSHADILPVATSGSTGEPMVVYADRAQLELRWAATLRAQEWTGYRLGDPTVRLWHQTIGMTRSQVWKERADAALANRTFIPVFSLGADLEPVVRTIERARPVLIDGYAEALDLLARFIAARGGLGWRPRAVMSSAQTLTDASRAAIEAAFGCPVFDKYGCRELSGIAYESEAFDGHLVTAEAAFVEILVDGRPARPGEIGEVVVTDLNNLCMPLLRYRIGDLAEATDQRPSRCGRGLPRIGAIHGRVQSILHGTDGRLVPGAFFGHLLKDYDHAFRRFQVVQDRPGTITLRVVRAPRYADDTLDEVKAIIRRHLGDDLRIDVEPVDDIELVRTGKRAHAISTLPVDLQRGGARVVAGPWRR